MLGSVHDIDIKLLRIFFAIHEHGGFTQAQLKLGISQANISAKMSKLEGRLGARLCDRGSSGFKLTPEGEMVIEACKRLFSALDDFQEGMSNLGSELKGDFNLGLVDNAITNPHCHIDRAISRLMDAAPAVCINISISDPAELEAQVLEGKLHLAIGLFNRSNPSLDYKPLYSTYHALYCGDQHELFSVADDEISDADLHEAKCLDRGYVESISDLALKVNLSTDNVNAHTNIEGLALLVLSGRYMASLPVHYAEQWVKMGKMRMIKPEKTLLKADVLAVYKAKKNIPAIITRFISELDLCHTSIPEA